MSIYKAYDIRGVYNETLTDEIMENIGKAVGTFMYRRGLGKKIVVGNDVRISSPALSIAFRKGILSAGIDVFNAGTVSFGVALFSGFTEKCVTAYITASHNPAEWNGIKFFGPDCVGFFEEDNKEIGRLVEKKEFINNGSGKEQEINKKGEYINFFKKKFRKGRTIKIVVDCGNGATSMIAPDVFREMGHQVVDLFCEPNGNFPGRGADVKEKEHCEALSKKVLEEKADLGLAFDGDGDRLAMVDEKGTFISPDMMAVVFAKEMIKGKETSKIICNIDCSMRMEMELEPMGAKIIRIPVGNTHMMQNAKKYNADFGTESSQHFVFPSYLPFDDGVVAGLKMAEMISVEGKTASSFFTALSPLPRFTTQIDCPDERKLGVMEEIERFSDIYTVDKTDGLRYAFDDGWGLIRPSNTSPSIRITAEGSTKEAAEIIFEKMKRLTEDII